jgi:hypothetical protein
VFVALQLLGQGKMGMFGASQALGEGKMGVFGASQALGKPQTLLTGIIEELYYK